MRIKSGASESIATITPRDPQVEYPIIDKFATSVFGEMKSHLPSSIELAANSHAEH
jgi:hypothetical protein